jgi:diguanylate cyclase (GGDEF)-like protein
LGQAVQRVRRFTALAACLSAIALVAAPAISDAKKVKAETPAAPAPQAGGPVQQPPVDKQDKAEKKAEKKADKKAAKLGPDPPDKSKTAVDLDTGEVDVDESDVALPAVPAAPVPVSAAQAPAPSPTPAPTAQTPPAPAPVASTPKVQSKQDARKRRAQRRKPAATATASSSGPQAPLAAAAAALTPARSTSASGRRSAAKRKSSPRPRRSVVEKIVGRVPVAYRLGLLAASLLAAGFALATARERRRAKRAESEALIDPLTGLANRRAFDRRLAEEWARSERYGRPLGLIMVDLDDFKNINDTRGHKEGDRVLRQMAALLSHRLRANDVTARLGGDEFAALCPETSSEGLEALTDSLSEHLKALPVGASIGFAERGPADQDPSDLLARADEAMYERKRASSAPALAGTKL